MPEHDCGASTSILTRKWPSRVSNRQSFPLRGVTLDDKPVDDGGIATSGPGTNFGQRESELGDGVSGACQHTRVLILPRLYRFTLGSDNKLCPAVTEPIPVAT